jgi:5-methylcytosine-specific restriction endonuclease McrA
MKTHITKMIIEHPTNKKIKYHLFADLNDKQQGITYKNVIDLCKKCNIEFKNQTLTGLVSEIQKNILNGTEERKKFTEEERLYYLNKFKVCNNKECRIKLNNDNFEIDHIIPLSQGIKAGGTNEEINLQCLCKPCHFDKTQEEEHEVKQTTYSCLNQDTENLFNSEHCKRLAFTEH